MNLNLKQNITLNLAGEVDVSSSSELDILSFMMDEVLQCNQT